MTIPAASPSARPRLPLLPLVLASVGLAVSLALLFQAWNIRRVARSYGSVELPRLSALPDFTATSETGATVTKASLSGKIWIADFVFTNCGGICPGLTLKMKSLQERLKDEPLVRLVSFTVDPDRDTPEVLARYGRERGADPERWMFLRTDKERIRTLCREGFKLAVEDADAKDVEPILHSTRFVLVDGAGTIRGYFDSAEAGAMEALEVSTRSLARTGPAGR
jgi:protein SCO1/2